MRKLIFGYPLLSKGLPLAPDIETDYSTQSLKRQTQYFKAFIWNKFCSHTLCLCLLCTFPNFVVYIFFNLSKRPLLKIFRGSACFMIGVNSQSNRWVIWEQGNNLKSSTFSKGSISYLSFS